MESQAELTVYIGHTATGTVTLACTVGDEHRSTDERLLRILVEHHSRHCEQLFVLLTLFVGLNDNLVVALVTDNHILVTDKFTKHLVKWLVLYRNTCRLVDVPQRDLLQRNLCICGLGNHLQHLAQRLVADPNSHRFLFPPRCILRLHTGKAQHKHHCGDRYSAEKPEIRNRFSHN